MSRVVKQIVIGVGFLVVFGFIGFGIYQLKVKEPTCADGIQNQGEEGIDCGFVCNNTCLDKLGPLEVLKTNILKVADGQDQKDYDVLLYLYNPNTGYGSSNIEYEISLFDADNAILLRKRNFGYILPGQTKYIYEPLLKTKREAKRAELKVTRVEWEKLRGISGESVNFMVKGKEFFYDQKPGVFGFVRSSVYNSSNFDFDRVDIVVMLYKTGNLIGANRTDLRTFASKTERTFEVDWPASLSAIPDRIDLEINTNVFNSANFIKNYGTQEKFQQLY